MTLNGLLSSDVDGDELEYSWTRPFSEGGGTVVGPTPTVTLGTGEHAIGLTVTDPGGLMSTDELIVRVIDGRAPRVVGARPSPQVL